MFVLVPGLFVVDGLAVTRAAAWITFVWVLLLGLLATIPIGMVLGAVLGNPRAVCQIGIFISAVLIAISGIFYPIAALPGWLHPIAQVFPVYWLGLGTSRGRS